uniref:Secreted protein n=1 Tax=Panagrellus redivivus TaxID=6233 RepID=A0A7E4UQ70_PANRE
MLLAVCLIPLACIAIIVYLYLRKGPKKAPKRPKVTEGQSDSTFNPSVTPAQYHLPRPPQDMHRGQHVEVGFAAYPSPPPPGPIVGPNPPYPA